LPGVRRFSLSESRGTNGSFIEHLVESSERRTSMANDSRPFVAIIGGLWMLKDPAAAEEAKEMAREIGAALAKAGMASLSISPMTSRLNPMWCQAM